MPLTLNIDDLTLFDPNTNEFTKVKGGQLVLEHSLLSISKWEMIWKVPFQDPGRKEFTRNQFIDYIRCMTIGKPLSDETYMYLPDSILNKVQDYIDDPMSATKIFSDRKNEKEKIVTSERIYAWMAELQIPFECEKWHLNRLLKLINIVSIDNTPDDKKKMNKKETAAYNRDLNERNRAKFNSKG